MAVMIKDQEQPVRIVCVGVEYLWRKGDEWKQWGYLRNVMHGAMLAMIGTGLTDAADDFEFLRDLTDARESMRSEEQYAQERAA